MIPQNKLPKRNLNLNRNYEFEILIEKHAWYATFWTKIFKSIASFSSWQRVKNQLCLLMLCPSVSQRSLKIIFFFSSIYSIELPPSPPPFAFCFCLFVTASDDHMITCSHKSIIWLLMLRYVYPLMCFPCHRKSWRARTTTLLRCAPQNATSHSSCRRGSST